VLNISLGVQSPAARRPRRALRDPAGGRGDRARRPARGAGRAGQGYLLGRPVELAPSALAPPSPALAAEISS